MIRQFFAALLAVLALNAFAAVDANQATRADLETVRGIGPGLSDKIIEARKTGNFKNWEDLVERVGGIGPRSASKLSQGGLTVAGNGFDGAALPAASNKAAKAGTTAKAAKSARGAVTDTAAVPAVPVKASVKSGAKAAKGTS